jgi:hypothetical protein
MTQLNYTSGQVRAIGKDVEETRTIEFVISTRARDRYHTVLNMAGWQLDNFNRNGIVGYMHNVYGADICNAPNPDDVIGSGRAWLEDGQLIGAVTFEPEAINPQAERIFRKVLHGTLKAASVGFMPVGEGRWGTGDQARGESNETYFYAGQELLEFSIVNIPGNPEAVRRSFRDSTARAMMFVRRALNDLGAEHYTFADIETMTVRDVLDLLDGNPSASPKLSASPGTPAETEAQQIREAFRHLRLRESIRAIGRN